MSEEVWLNHECYNAQDILDSLENERKLKEENEKLKECVNDFHTVFKAYDNLNLSLCNMKGVRELDDPTIIHWELLKEIEELKTPKGE